MPNKIRYILTDIEGTTTDIAFVHTVLFPYAAAHIGTFVQKNEHEKNTATYLKQVRETILEETSETDTSIKNCLKYLEYWIATDRKHPALKGLQGLLWRAGYESGEFKGHIYNDVVPKIEQWRNMGIGIGIYSSGSVMAQKLLVGFSEYGDLTHLFDHHFDTAVGHKQDVVSYQNIAKKLAISPANILFLSDIEAELVAANAAGMHVLQLVREGTIPSTKFATMPSFEQIQLPV